MTDWTVTSSSISGIRRMCSRLRQTMVELARTSDGGWIGGRVTAQAGGLGDMTRIAAIFETSGIELDDLGLARPSLDDVFLHLTGHRAEDETASELTDEGVAQ